MKAQEDFAGAATRRTPPGWVSRLPARHVFSLRPEVGIRNTWLERGHANNSSLGSLKAAMARQQLKAEPMNRTRKSKARRLLQALALASVSVAAAAGYDEGLTAHRLATAVRECRAAAEQGDAEAQFKLGFMYANGYGVSEDDTEAARWFRKAAEQGYAKAQYNLGFMYDKGEGVPEDQVRAYAWRNLAAAQGDASAKRIKKLLASLMTPAQIAEAQARSRKLEQRIAARKAAAPDGRVEKSVSALQPTRARHVE